MDDARRGRAGAELADEDTTGGFEHGGWHTRYFHDLLMSWVVENVSGAGGYLLGRGTYEMFAAHWPNVSQEERTLAEPLNALPKYVASRTLAERSSGRTQRCCRATSARPCGLRRRSARDLVVIARDRHIRTRPGERRLLRDAGLRVFWIAGKKDLSTWEWLGRLVRHWDAMEEIIRTRGAGPWFQAINERGLSEIPLD